jgi:hypothetical protein
MEKKEFLRMEKRSRKIHVVFELFSKNSVTLII